MRLLGTGALNVLKDQPTNLWGQFWSKSINFIS
jgi:hypothetical protein